MRILVATRDSYLYISLCPLNGGLLLFAACHIVLRAKFVESHKHGHSFLSDVSSFILPSFLISRNSEPRSLSVNAYFHRAKMYLGIEFLKKQR